MKLNKFILCSVAFVMVTSTVIMGGCKSKDKEIVLSENVAKDIQVEENEIEKYIKEGNKFLEEKNYTEARKSYEAAITKGKNDKQIYMDIKDQYLNKNRYDDAYYIIKLAIENKVDTENMEKVLTSIRDKMESVELSYEIYEDKDSFVLPEEVDITVDNNKVKDYVLWEKENRDISNKPGQYSYNGVTKEYGRNVHVTLNVKANIKEDIKENAKEDIYDSKFGIVKDIYTDNGTVYISFDEAEFYFGWEEAVAEAVKDNKAMQKEDGTYTLPDPYYIRYHIGEIKVYEVSKDASFNLLAYDVDPSNNHTSELQSVDYSTFKKKIDNWKGGYVSNLQFNVDMKNGIVTKMSKQYTP
ncbi:Ig-like domain-containing protein [uncultured Clostridium sp.]|uniref:Ig-like domain-containing protein n=1 Tax=uncultured Clostridium sp. TaxID=59620 RepID=UPI0032168833